MKKKSMISFIAALSAAGMLSAAVGADPAPYTLATGTSYNKTSHAVDVAGSARGTYYNAMVMKKVLQVDDTSNVPECTFTFTATAPTPISGDLINRCILPTSTTLGVYSGLAPENIKWSLVNTDATEVKFSADNTVTSIGQAAAATFKYESQAIADPTATAKAADNVIINGTEADDGYYYAIKELQLDFSECGFTEPGVYRYYITETAPDTNSGIRNDVLADGTTLGDCVRTVDVYVEDCFPDTTDGTKHQIGIAGYVMYVGTVTAAPANGDSEGTGTNQALEDGLVNEDLTGNTTKGYGTGNTGGEVSGAVKSEGFKNVLDTNKLTFKKTVVGNQGSKNKYFKFAVKLTDEVGKSGSLKATDVFKISTVTTETIYDQTPAANSATVYTDSQMASNNVTSLTGTQLSTGDGYLFYLHDNQQITITGIPNGLGYVITEFNEDYDPSITNGVSGSTYDTYEGGTNTNTALTLDKTNANGAVSANNVAVLTDTALVDNAFETFTNERKGAIPTGIVLSVAAPVGIGAAAAAGIIYLALKSRKKKDEE